MSSTERTTTLSKHKNRAPLILLIEQIRASSFQYASLTDKLRSKLDDVCEFSIKYSGFTEAIQIGVIGEAKRLRFHFCAGNCYQRGRMFPFHGQAGRAWHNFLEKHWPVTEHFPTGGKVLRGFIHPRQRVHCFIQLDYLRGGSLRPPYSQHDWNRWWKLAECRSNSTLYDIALGRLQAVSRLLLKLEEKLAIFQRGL